MVAVWVVVHWITGRTHLAILATAALAVSSWRCLLPTSFELNPDGVHRRVLGRHRQIPWEQIRRWEMCPRGVLLLPWADRWAMDAFGALYLPWGTRRQEVLAQLHFYLGPPPGQ